MLTFQCPFKVKLLGFPDEAKVSRFLCNVLRGVCLIVHAPTLFLKPMGERGTTGVEMFKYQQFCF